MEKRWGPPSRKRGDCKDCASVPYDQLAVVKIREAEAAGAFGLNFQPTVSLDESDDQYLEVSC